MKIAKKVCIYILVGLITVTGTFSSFYKGAYAFEYVGGALAFEEAIKWLLASVGIISAGGMTADYWENHSQEFEDYCTQQNITDTEVANWQLKLCEGILDKGSECWQAFKEWASTLTGTGSGGSSISYTFDNFISTRTISYDNGYSFTYNSSLINSLNNSVNNYSGKPVYFSSTGVANITVSLSNNAHIWTKFYYLNPNYNYTITDSGVSCDSRFDYFYIWVADSGGYYGCSYEVNKSSLNYITTGDSFLGSYIHYGVVDSDFISVQPDVTDLDIISSPIPDTDAQEVAIPMPGVSDSDNEASADAYDNIVDQVNDGTLELDDAITQVIDTLKIIVYEQETEKIFPKPENEEDQEDLDDKINENKDNMGFTLGGLETVFPFCIPWDIYAFINLLRADPVPPKIELPFPNPLDPENPWTVEVDFSDWDDGMRIVRLAEDFLFIIGLAFLTRSLIGAGGGDG